MSEQYKQLENFYEGILPLKTVAYLAEISGILILANGLNKESVIGIPIYITGRIANEFLSRKRDLTKTKMDKILEQESGN